MNILKEQVTISFKGIIDLKQRQRSLLIFRTDEGTTKEIIIPGETSPLGKQQQLLV
jgi:hypothetical protein